MKLPALSVARQVTLVFPVVKREPEAGSQVIPGGFGSQLSEAVTVQETAWGPVTEIAEGQVIAGASVSVTVIENWQSACPPGPLAEQETTVSPTPTELPEGGSQVTEVAQVEEGTKLVIVPQRRAEEPVVELAGQVMVGITGVPTQRPSAEQVSPVVQALPSSQGTPGLGIDVQTQSPTGQIDWKQGSAGAVQSSAEQQPSAGMQ